MHLEESLLLSRRFVPLRKVPFRLESVLMVQQEGMENLTSANDYVMLDIVIIFLCGIQP